MSESKIKNDAIDTTNTDISNILNLNTENSNIVSIDKNIRAENIKKLHYILKEINYIRKKVRSNGGKTIFALNNEDSRKAIIQTMVNIYESIKKIQKTNDIDILSLFHKYELKALDTVRNITSHDSKKLHLGQTKNVINKHVINVEKKIKAYLTPLKEAKLENKELANEKAKKIIHQKSKTRLEEKILTIGFKVLFIVFFCSILSIFCLPDDVSFSILPIVVKTLIFLFLFYFGFIIYFGIKYDKFKPIDYNDPRYYDPMTEPSGTHPLSMFRDDDKYM